MTGFTWTEHAAGSVGAIIQEMGKIVPDSADLEQTIFNPNYRAAFVGEQLTYHTLWQRISQKYGDVSDLQNEMLTLQMERVVNGDNFHKILLALDKGGAVGAQTRVLLMLAVASLSDEANRTSFVEAALRKVGVLTPEVEAKLQGGSSAAAQSNAAEARGYIAGRVFTELVLLAAPAAKSFQAVRVGTAAQLIDAAAINASQKAGLAMESVAVAEQAQLADALNAGRMPAIPVTKLELAVHRSLRANYGDAQALALQNATYEGATQARAALGTLVLKGDGAVTLAKDAEQLTLRLVAKLRNRYQVVLSPASVEQLGNVVTRATLARAAQKGVAVGNQFLQDLYATMQAVTKSGQKLGFSPTAYIETVVDGMYQIREAKGFKLLMGNFAGTRSNLGLAEQFRWASRWQRIHGADASLAIVDTEVAAGSASADFKLADGTLVEVKAGTGNLPKVFSDNGFEDLSNQLKAIMKSQVSNKNVVVWLKNYDTAWASPLNQLKTTFEAQYASKNVHLIFHMVGDW